MPVQGAHLFIAEFPNYKFKTPVGQLPEQRFQRICSRLPWGSSRHRVSRGSVPDSCGEALGTEFPKDVLRTPVGGPPGTDSPKDLFHTLVGPPGTEVRKHMLRGP